LGVVTPAREVVYRLRRASRGATKADVGELETPDGAVLVFIGRRYHPTAMRSHC